jgi:hypothetical protein
LNGPEILVGKAVENYHLEHRAGNARITLKYNFGRYYGDMKWMGLVRDYFW